MNLPEKLQVHLGYPKLQTINTATNLPENEAEFNALNQSVLITFLVGLYKATRTKENSTIVNGILKPDELINNIFDNQWDILDRIAAYTNESISVVKQKLQEVATGYLEFVQLQTPETEEILKEDQLHNLMTSQRNEILKYLPPSLKLGDLLNDTAIDDNTNKMEGPISTLMHKIENTFSQTD